MNRAMRLREWRLTQNLTQQQCADLFGLKHARNYQRYESGEILPDAPFVMAVAEKSEGLVSTADIYAQRHDWLAKAGFLTCISAVDEQCLQA